jgi:hypothetical protein
MTHRAASANPLARLLELGAAFMAMIFAVFVLYVLFAARVHDGIVTQGESDDLGAPHLCRGLCATRR